MEKYTYPVKGMTCAACVKRVEKLVNKSGAASDISVNLATEALTFTANPETFNPYELKTVIDDYGYELVIPDDGPEKTNKIKEDNSEYNELWSDLVFAAAITLPIFVISMLWDFSFFREIWPLSKDYTNKLLLIFTTPVIFISGKRFYQIFWLNLKKFNAEMNSLVAVGTGAAFIYSAFATLFPEVISESGVTPSVYFETAAVIITLVLMGRLLEARAKKNTTSAIKELLKLKPEKATILINDKLIEIPSANLKLNDTVVIKPGDKIPADGVVITGSSSVDESMLTGESIPVEKAEKDNVYTGTINQNGSFRFTITALEENSFLGKIVKYVEEAQGSKVPIQRLADKIAGIFTPIVILIAVATFVLWLFLGGSFQVSLINAVAVLIVACPCALGLATPTAIMVGSGKGAKNGILFKNGESLEILNKAKVAVFDKTGTLTEGKPVVTGFTAVENLKDELLEISASIEKLSTHPLAKAVTEYCSIKGISGNLQVTSFSNISGKGITAKVNDSQYFIGSLAEAQKNAHFSPLLVNIKPDTPDNSSTIVALSKKNEIVALFEISDSLRPEAKKLISVLKNADIKPVLLSGDREASVKDVAVKLGIEKFYFEVMPDQKADIISKLQSEGELVIMVGDGINDAPALVKADIGIAMGSGTDVAIESADVTILHNDLNKVTQAINLSRKTIVAIKQNLFWAFIYNTLGIPLAAFGLLNPMLAALAMSLSSVSVVSNSLRLRSKKI